MKLLKIRAEGLPLIDNDTEIDFLTESPVRGNEQHELIHLFKNFYLNRTLTFTGLNAAGKTQILNVISFVMNLIQAKPINNTVGHFFNNTSNILNLGIEEKAKLTIYFYSNHNEDETINKLETTITRTKDSSDDQYKYFITDEKLFIKNTKKIRSKNDLYNFDIKKLSDIDVKNRNSDDYLALSNDVSLINVFYNLKKYKKLFFRDMVGFTDFNVLSNFGNVPIELIKFLDPSIEFLKFKFIKDNEEENFSISLKFIHDDRIITLDSPTELNSVLSSGTVKGLGLFMTAIATLVEGGVLIVDELENHFNREISLTLIHLFTDRKVNKEGAILIFTTHYSELLDTLDRNDSIYIVKKDNKISLQKLSSELKRNDIRKSDQFIKGILKHTAPKYDAEINLKRFIKNAKKK